jgi:hypothetical protein
MGLKNRVCGFELDSSGLGEGTVASLENTVTNLQNNKRREISGISELKKV